jgi:uncharacterized membrane protein
MCYFRALKIGDAAKVAPIESFPSFWWRCSEFCFSESA